ncbi:MAG: ATP-binding cassette domain-containing protein [Gammaproteobacteria bacterium]|nr:ATP-binding cassette domain-containing protein [Gammaproteobacteria bacterium]MYL02217.1 ATP-binding cassette domain-containing protein [Gammaproteobacteria bacterium]
MTEPLLSVRSLCVDYEQRRPSVFGSRASTLRAVNDISFELCEGETLGIVGETGCGKTSLGKAILQLVPPAAGRVLWRGVDLAHADPKTLTKLRSELQIVFQDPLSALNPRMPVGEIVAEPLRVHAADMSARERQAAVADIFVRVGLRPEMTGRYPNEFSSGQCQRISIARAMITGPKLLVCDEPVSALDVSIQAQICNLLRRLQRETGIAILFISHDLSVLRYMSHRVMVLYLGRLMEIAPRDELFENPRHPYSRALIDAIPEADPDRGPLDTADALPGEIPSALNPPSGCVFRTRCPIATPECARTRPLGERVSASHRVACHHWREARPRPRQ